MLRHFINLTKSILITSYNKKDRIKQKLTIWDGVYIDIFVYIYLCVKQKRINLIIFAVSFEQKDTQKKRNYNSDNVNYNEINFILFIKFILSSCHAVAKHNIGLYNSRYKYERFSHNFAIYNHE